MDGLMLEILVADDHKLLREGLKPFLLELADDVVVLEAATFGETQAAAAAAQELRLILLDLSMPGMNGMRGVEALHGEHPDVPLVILSGDSRRETVLGAVQAGASGFISKTVSGVAMVNALRLVLSGETYLPSSAIADDEYDAGPESGTSSPRPSLLAGLSPRDREILALVVEGLTNKAIGRRIGLQEVTIKAHLRSLYRRIGAANRAQAVRIALQSQ
ncbi:MAG: response regulator transcription factor [Rhodospirillaceae bacterium]